MLTDPAFPVTCAVSSTTWHSSAAKVPTRRRTLWLGTRSRPSPGKASCRPFERQMHRKEARKFGRPHRLPHVYANMLLDCWGIAEKKTACATKKEERRRTINSKERNLPVSTIKFLPIRLVRLVRIKSGVGLLLRR